jgi:hypothetical protein
MLLAAVARVLAAGDDPEAVLRDALARHVDRQHAIPARNDEKKGRT